MTIREHIDIAASPTEVWPLFANPNRMGVWNRKLSSVSRRTDLTVCLGERFTAGYVMSGRPRPTNVEVIACEPTKLVTCRHH